MSEEDLIPELELEDDSHGVPVLPLRDVVVYPHMVIPLFVGRDKSIVALDKAMAAGPGVRWSASSGPTGPGRRRPFA